MPQTVTVTVSETGEVEVEAKGVKGTGCKALTEAIERSLGSTVSDKATPEMFRQAAQGQAARAGQ